MDSSFPWSVFLGFLATVSVAGIVAYFSRQNLITQTERDAQRDERHLRQAEIRQGQERLLAHRQLVLGLIQDAVSELEAYFRLYAAAQAREGVNPHADTLTN